MTSGARPTLLVFTLGEVAESRRRRLLPAPAAGEEPALHRSLLDAVLAAGHSVGCHCVVATPRAIALPPAVEWVRQPSTGSFADRLRSSLRAAWTETGPVVLVGSDVPGLGAPQLRAALGALDRDPEAVVVGPSPDGGCYLVATRQPLDAALAATRWCSRRTLQTLRAALAREGRRIVLLAPLADLDCRADLEGWLAHPAPLTSVSLTALHWRLRRLLFSLRLPPRRRPEGLPARHFVAPLAARAPPLRLA